MMTKLWLYAYAMGATSSRKLERLAQRDVGFMMLAAGKGAHVTLEVDGPDETEAMSAIVALVNDYFGEGQ